MVLWTAGAMVGVNAWVDCYGLFRDPQGRKLAFHSNDGTSKYLLSHRYIPANFDGLLIGSSVSASWDLARIDGVRLYNASINGGNISDERRIAENVFAHGRMKLVVFCIHPYLTASHGQKTGDMTPRSYWGALGSIQLLKEYGNLLRARLGQIQALGDENGREFYEPAPDIIARLQAGTFVAKPITVDEAAFAEYREVVEAARAHGARVMAFIPPIYSGFYESHKKDYEAYFARMSGLFRPGEEVINFNLPRYSAYTGNRAVFYDGSHLTGKAAVFFSSELAAALRPLVAALTPGAGVEPRPAD